MEEVAKAPKGEEAGEAPKGEVKFIALGDETGAGTVEVEVEVGGGEETVAFGTAFPLPFFFALKISSSSVLQSLSSVASYFLFPFTFPTPFTALEGWSSSASGYTFGA